MWSQMFIGLRVTYRFACRISTKLKFLGRFSKNTQMSHVMKIRLVVAELFHADGRTDRQTDRYKGSNSRFSQFC
jgi:hypothetical protein